MQSATSYDVFQPLKKWIYLNEIARGYTDLGADYVESPFRKKQGKYLNESSAMNKAFGQSSYKE